MGGVITKTMSRQEGINQGKKLLGFPNLKFIATDDSFITINFYLCSLAVSAYYEVIIEAV